MTTSPRARAQAIAAQRGGRHTLAVPFALRLAARIQERPLEDFFGDPTQLANGLRDFVEAVGPDGVMVTAPDVVADEVASTPAEALVSAPRVTVAVEATKRLHSTLSGSEVLVAALPGPATLAEARGSKQEVAEVLQALTKEFLSAGVDVLLFMEESSAGVEEFQAPLRTVANMARFHRTAVFLHGADLTFLRAPVVVGLSTPKAQEGLVITETDLPTDTSISDVQDWVRAVGSS